jgi:hypothetical protein
LSDVLLKSQNENFKFEMNMLYKMLLNTLTGGIGGIIGVNMKKD